MYTQEPPHSNPEIFKYSHVEQQRYDARQEELKTEKAARSKLIENVHDESLEEFNERTVAFYRKRTDGYLQEQLKDFICLANSQNGNVKFPHFRVIQAVLEERKAKREKESSLE
jgi:hypothetical protein